MRGLKIGMAADSFSGAFYDEEAPVYIGEDALYPVSPPYQQDGGGDYSAEMAEWRREITAGAEAFGWGRKGSSVATLRVSADRGWNLLIGGELWEGYDLLGGKKLAVLFFKDEKREEFILEPQLDFDPEGTYLFSLGEDGSTEQECLVRDLLFTEITRRFYDTGIRVVVLLPDEETPPERDALTDENTAFLEWNYVSSPISARYLRVSAGRVAFQSGYSSYGTDERWWVEFTEEIEAPEGQSFSVLDWEREDMSYLEILEGVNILYPHVRKIKLLPNKYH